ncbi:exodeoxyribonuclease VII large subunit [Ferrimonas lipolytica]|uniref:Exodeoxyribonuclease 7 large subunit n=1 Tax=Ferrimonas lipolytica TaxID=2724191 RepID=A0A6H1UD32_9GAMM|nr:exodeoxyribonuclease VII large subunit [Ferrimonas lipolytica]QIZ76981.1 exodeoxyribonuclease VII large subunit [Ferrimonas lipolytica]
MFLVSNNILTVSGLSRQIKQLLEGNLGRVWLSGEISNLATPASGHIYFTLKDDRSQIRCAMFRSRAGRVTFAPANGQQVLVRANLTMYEPRGDIQLVVESMQPAGDGLLQQQFDALKMRLAAEGLFATAAKQPLPKALRRLGVITSASGAAIQDVLSVLQRRDPMLQVVIYPTLVQGRDATASICQALYTANQRNEVDCLLLTRGGGSMEDLWCFNEEAVARAVFASTLPVISAVGHEVDTTICDFVADVRAPTPSAAAELLSQDRSHLLRQTEQLQQRLLRATRGQLTHQQHRLALLASRLDAAHPKNQLQTHYQRLDELSARLHRGIEKQLQLGRFKQQQLSQRLMSQHPQRRITSGQQQLTQLQRRLVQGQQQLLQRNKLQLAKLVATLEGVSPLAVLSRGYAIPTNAKGSNIVDSAQVEVGETIKLRLHRGNLAAKVTSTS